MEGHTNGKVDMSTGSHWGRDSLLRTEWRLPQS